MKQAIVLVSFGVGDIEKKHSLDKLIENIAIEFPDFYVFNAWLSRLLIDKISQQGEKVFSFSEMLDRLWGEKYEHVVIQPTILSKGEEYFEKLLPVYASFENKFPTVYLGTPVLDAECIDDYERIIRYVLPIDELKHGEELVMMGHGTVSSTNSTYQLLQEEIDKRNIIAHIGVFEGDTKPQFADVLARLKRNNAKKVYLCPLLFSSQKHVYRDMIGDASNSWRAMLENSGIEVRYNLEALSEKKGFFQLLVEKIRMMKNSGI